MEGGETLGEVGLQGGGCLLAEANTVFEYSMGLLVAYQTIGLEYLFGFRCIFLSIRQKTIDDLLHKRLQGFLRVIYIN